MSTVYAYEQVSGIKNDTREWYKDLEMIFQGCKSARQWTLFQKAEASQFIRELVFTAKTV